MDIITTMFSFHLHLHEFLTSFGALLIILFIILLPALIAASITWLITPLVIKLYHHYGWDRNHASHRQQTKDTHQGHIPRGGGLAIFAGLSISLVIYLLLQDFIQSSLLLQIGAIFLGAAILTLTGVLDDIYDLPPWPRLLANLLAVIPLIFTGLTINFVTNPFGSGVLEWSHIWWLPPLATITYVITLINFTNWAKGVDGQLPGVVAIAAFVIGGVSLLQSSSSDSVLFLSCLIAGSFLGFLYWNFYPQKIMPGYGGGSLAGFFLAVLSIMAGAKIATLFMILALPIADAFFTILRRLIAGKSIFLGDRGHLHHKLLDELGWGRRRIAIFYYLATLVMGLLALILPTWGKIITFLAVVGLVFGFLITIKLKHLAKVA